MEDTLTLREIAPPKPATPLPATGPEPQSPLKNCTVARGSVIPSMTGVTEAEGEAGVLPVMEAIATSSSQFSKGPALSVKLS